MYSVDLTWEDMTFTYNESGSRTWDPDTHTYTDTTSAGWDKVTAAVNGHQPLQRPGYGQIRLYPAGRYRVNASMSKDSFKLAAGVENRPNEAATDSSILTITGTPNNSVYRRGRHHRYHHGHHRVTVKLS